MLRACQPADAARICEIYNPFVRETVVTFEEEPVSALEMARRTREVGFALPWLVWEEAGRLRGIALPNDASVALHERLGFTKVAHFREIGRKFGRWVDVGYWEVLLRAGAGPIERR